MKKIFSLPFLCIVLFISLAGVYWIWYEREADRKSCLINIRNAQVAMRSYQGGNGLNVGAKFDLEAMQKEFFADRLTKKVDLPECPSGGVYTWGDVIQDLGVPALRCSHPSHVPKNMAGWE